ncbi:MAG: hypothetical protein ABI270_03610 [Nitrosospira sp.]
MNSLNLSAYPEDWREAVKMYRNVKIGIRCNALCYCTLRLRTVAYSIRAIACFAYAPIGAAGGDVAGDCGASVRERTVRSATESVSQRRLPNL